MVSFDEASLIRDITNPKIAPDVSSDTRESIPVSDVGFSESEERRVKTKDTTKKVSIAPMVSISMTSAGLRSEKERFFIKSSEKRKSGK